MKIRVLLLLCTCMLIIGVTGCSNKATSAEGETYLIFSSETSANDADKSITKSESVNAGNSFSVIDNGQIYDLIMDFYIKIMEKDLLGAMSYTDVYNDYDTFSVESEQIVGIDSLQCYVVNGMIDGTYVVVATREVSIDGIDTELKDVDYYYICTDESGNLYIDGSPVSDEVNSYNAIVVENQTIQDLVVSAQKYNKQYLTDNKLKSIIPGNTPKFLYELE